MPPFDPRIPRLLAVQLGQEAVDISEAGRYVGPDGERDIFNQVRASVDKTICYGPDHTHEPPATGPHFTKFEVTNETTLSAHLRHQAKGLAVVSLNFASATHPGGGFLRGARAQEEYLCRSSALYLSIKGSPMYAYHREKGDCLYSDAMIYSPGVPVFRGDDHELLASPYPASFITSAAPLATHVNLYELKHLPKVIYGRALKVLAVAKANGHDSLVLGAWGCGAFGNNGSLVADIFHKALTQDFAGTFKEVSFAIVDTSPEGRFIRPFSRRFSPEAIGSAKAEKMLTMADAIERTDLILRKHLDMPEAPYADLSFFAHMKTRFAECDAMIFDLELEFRMPTMNDPDVSRMQTVRQLYEYVLRNGREP
jgi:uncharacterized protein (TIGR02452 family)